MTDEKNHREETDQEETKSLPRADGLSTGKAITVGFRLIVITVALTSVLYTLVPTGIGSLIWPELSRGSLLQRNGEVVGSKLIGQAFTSDKYFHPRPSSKDFGGMNSGSANLSPTNDRLKDRVRRILEKLEEEGVKPDQVPVSFVTESGSALDPHIVPESAYLQIPRISQATGIERSKLNGMVEKALQGKFLGLYGQRRVNVLSLNLNIEIALES